jgi:hypothetical protein
MTDQQSRTLRLSAEPTFHATQGVLRMNAQERVLDRFPSGEARREPAEFLPDFQGWAESGWWVIFAGPDPECEELGRGRSEAEAWSDAAGLSGNQAA